MKALKTTFIFILILLLPSIVSAEAKPSPDGWPRMFEDKGNKVLVYQPQLDEWKDYKVLYARAAVSVTLKGGKKEYFGALHLHADTETIFDPRTVQLKNLQITKLTFPDLDDKTASACRQAVKGALPKNKSLVKSLDRILAGLERSKELTKTAKVNLDPPPIFYSETPAVLVNFMGEPKFEAVKGVSDLLYTVNTNWDILLEIGSSKYFMLNGDSWLVTKDVQKGPWKAASTLPRSFMKLPNSDNWKDVKKKIPGIKAKIVPRVFVSKKPAELIVTEGTPSYSPIAGTRLLYVTNTDSDLFLYSGDKNIYFLTAGRWFKAKSVKGPWKAASIDLPDDFKKIPTSHDKGRVLSSVPETPEAEAAVLMASIPRKATVNRKDTTINVVYEGKPKFEIIEGASDTLHYAVNTPYSVFSVEGMYYCVHNGVWFESTSPAGPWVVSVVIPQVIYTIPADHPKYNVTYVYVYDSTPDVVVVGYTSGYSGTYITTTGVVVYGSGYWVVYSYPYPYYHYHYHPYYYSYGSAYSYNYYYGGYYRAARYYGPYGGAGGAAGYNPATGTYYRGGYAHGPYGRAFAREAYNPYTDRYAAQVGGKTAYGSWGRSVVSEGDKWAKAGHRTFDDKAVGGIRTSEGGVARGAYNKETGQGVVVGKDKYGDVYAGRDGEVYKRGDEGWQKKTKEGWESVGQKVDRDALKSKVESRGSKSSRSDLERGLSKDQKADRAASLKSKIKSSGSKTSRSDLKSKFSQSASRSRTFDNLNRASRSRNLGNQRSQRSRSFNRSRNLGSQRSRSVNRGGGSRGGRGSFGGGRSGGGGRRR